MDDSDDIGTCDEDGCQPPTMVTRVQSMVGVTGSDSFS